MTDELSRLFSIAGKTAVVTGGAKGVGAMISETLVSLGVHVLIVSRDAGQGATFAKGFKGPGSATHLCHDLSSMEGLEAAVEDIKATTETLNILVNNAGVFDAGPMEETDAGKWDALIDVNLRAPFFLSQKLLGALKAASSDGNPGRIVHIGSIGALWGKSSNGAYAYGASKAAIHQLTRMMASDLTAQGITVNAIAPGFFPSDMTDGFFSAVPGLKDQVVEGIPAGRLGSKDDVGGTVAFLCSRAGAYISGSILPLEGALWQA